MQKGSLMDTDTKQVLDGHEENDEGNLNKTIEAYKKENQQLKDLASSYEIQLVNAKKQLAQVMNDMIQ